MPKVGMLEMADYEALRLALFNAFLKAAEEMGDDLKSLSWFGRNHRGGSGENEQAA